MWTWPERWFFIIGGSAFFWLLMTIPELAFMLGIGLGIFWGGIYVGWKGRGNHDMERYLGRWLT